MKAYRMKLKGDDDAPVKIVITKAREVAPGYEIIGGPIGGENILPLKNGEPDQFVPFTVGDKLIKNAGEMRKAYEIQQADAPKEEEVKEEEIVIEAVEPKAKPKGKPGRPAKKAVDDDDDEEDDAA